MLTTSTLKKYFGLLQIIAVIALCVSLNACQKDSNEFISTGSHIDSIPLPIQTFSKPGDTLFIEEPKGPMNPLAILSVDKLHEALALNIKTPFSDTFTAEKGKKITFPDSSTVEILANICTKSPDGNAGGKCTGTLKVELLVLRTKGELLAYNLPTVTDDGLLQSGGVVRVRITQNGFPVFVQQGQYIKVTYKMPSTVPDMKYWNGDIDMNNSRLNFDWNLVEDQSRDNPRLKAIDSATYQLLIDRFSWVNCDRLYGDDKTQLTKSQAVALPDSFSNQNTSVFVVFKDILSLVRLQGDPKKKVFDIPQNYKGLPTGKAVTVVSISLFSSKNAPDRLYYSATPATIGDKNIIQPKPTAITLDALKLKLLAL